MLAFSQASHHFSCHRGKKGIYWKVEGEDLVHYSKHGRRSGRVRDEGVEFPDPPAFFEHRARHGWPEDWDGIIEVPPPGPPPRDHSGLFWKIEGTDQVYFSKSRSRPRADIAFADPDEFFRFRRHNGWPEDWSEIEELPEDFWPDSEISRYNAKGCYWKYEGEDAVHYSKHCRFEGPYWSLTDDITFENPDEFFEHRADHGYPANWDWIREVPADACQSQSDSSSSDWVDY